MHNPIRKKTGLVRSIASDNSGNFEPGLDGHFLANRGLSRKKVEGLLLSASFGTNSVLYAVFLGYLMGVWALIVQVAWLLSFFLLARNSRQVYRATSLHEFLGQKFGTTTRVLAALCSIAGITYFVGWEVAIANSALQSTVAGNIASTYYIGALLFFGIAVAIFYSSSWGRSASGSINVWLNAVKIICLLFLLILLGYSFVDHGYNLTTLLPPFGEAIAAVGIIGFITNIVFNISWQFVDNSSWQSISSADDNDGTKIARGIKHTGMLTLLTVNGIGTLLGALLRNAQGIDSTNALGQIVQNISLLPYLAIFAMVILIILSAISLFDGAILSISQSILVDMRIRGRAQVTTLRLARVITLLVGIISAWGVERLIALLGGSIFDMVYIVILTQLCLIGPVIVGLTQKKQTGHMWLALAISFVTAVVVTSIGIVYNNQYLLQIAGTVVTVVSIISSFTIYELGRLIGSKQRIS